MRTVLKLPPVKTAKFAMLLAAMSATLIAVVAGAATNAAAQPTETVLYNFVGGTSDGANPWAGLAIDSSGNLYGATLYGGSYGQGTVYEFPLNATTDKVLCNLPGGDDPLSTPGANPTGAPIFVQSSGVIYGTAQYDSSDSGKGVVYACTPNPTGSAYTYSVLHQFGAGGTSDGANPWAGVSIDSAGAYLYGTTVNGGTSSDGTIFKEPIGGGTGSPTLYNFTGGTTGYGAQPYGGVIIDNAGNLAGATTNGGTVFAGTIYVTTTTGTPTYHYYFGGGSNYGSIARSSLYSDSFGDHIGTTMLGGTYSNGLVYNLFALGGGNYNYSVLYPFKGGITDGANPWSSVVMDSSGDIYGTTASGGANGYGVVYELTPSGSTYSETVLYSFAGGTSDGANPYSTLVMDSSGNLYGTTQNGGLQGHGIIFKITFPPALRHKPRH